MLSDCSKHRKDVAGISDMKVIAEMIGDLHYESLSAFMFAFKEKLFKDGIKDIKNGKSKLGSHLLEAAKNIQSAWLISKPFMDQD